MNKSESKYFNTAVRMDEALMSLLEKKDFSYITVKEICEVAQVNRSTFYLHYENTSDLLDETLEYANEKFLNNFKTNTAQIMSKIKTGTLDELIFITPEYLNPYLNFIKENRQLFILASKYPKLFHAQIKYENMYLYIFEPIFERFSLEKHERKYMLAFYVYGIMGIVMEWLKEDCVTEVEIVSNMISKFIFEKYNFSKGEK
ncbi:MAG: TetR/AcrR family transcriptional regulator [Lachnospiraceae bacterium]|nr:TetR/AcrR family transcriptional regulator [Lachnospiraceae bacterium]